MRFTALLASARKERSRAKLIALREAGVDARFDSCEVASARAQGGYVGFYMRTTNGGGATWDFRVSAVHDT